MQLWAAGGADWLGFLNLCSARRVGVPCAACVARATTRVHKKLVDRPRALTQNTSAALTLTHTDATV